MPVLRVGRRERCAGIDFMIHGTDKNRRGEKAENVVPIVQVEPLLRPDGWQQLACPLVGLAVEDAQLGEQPNLAADGHESRYRTAGNPAVIECYDPAEAVPDDRQRLVCGDGPDRLVHPLQDLLAVMGVNQNIPDPHSKGLHQKLPQAMSHGETQ